MGLETAPHLWTTRSIRGQQREVSSERRVVQRNKPSRAGFHLRPSALCPRCLNKPS